MTRTEIKKSTKSANDKERYFKFKYKKYFDNWNLHYTDDRQLFCNIYKQVLESMLDLHFCKAPFMFVAFNERLHKEEIILAEIIERFN